MNNDMYLITEEKLKEITKLKTIYQQSEKIIEDNKTNKERIDSVIRKIQDNDSWDADELNAYDFCQEILKKLKGEL